MKPSTSSPPRRQHRASLAVAVLVCTIAAPAAALAAEPGPSISDVRHQVEVRRGDTLDRVIRRTLPELGLKPELVRATFIELNPQAFVRGRPGQLRAGVQLTVPSQADLRQRALSDYPALGELMQTPAPVARDRSEEIRLRWIRYP